MRGEAKRVARALVLLIAGCRAEGQEDPARVVEHAVAERPSRGAADGAQVDGTNSVGLADDRRFEQEYWDIVGRTDTLAMDFWLLRARWRTQLDGSERARLTMLEAGGALMLFRGGNLLEYLDALALSKSARDLAPASLNAAVFYRGVLAFQKFVAGDDAGALGEIDRLTTLGTEGNVAAALALAMVRRNRYIDRAISLLEDCETDVCNKTSQVAPFKPVGMLLSLAEIYGRRGDAARMDSAFARAEASAQELKWPLMARIDELRRAIPAEKAAWDADTSSIGSIALPLPKTSEEDACANCHVGAQAR